MKCPHCNAEISGLSPICPYCAKDIGSASADSSQQAASQPQTQAYASPNPQNGAQPTVQSAAPYYYSTAPGYMNPPTQKGKTGGEIAAIVIAVIVSILSVIAAMVIFVIYANKFSDTINDYDYGDLNSYYDEFEEYGIDDFTDEDSLDHFFDYYSSIIGSQSQYPASAPAEEHTPIEIDDYLLSFSDGTISTQYSVELDEVYRGDAAAKLLEGARLPEVADGKELYLVKFKLTIIEQETETYVNPSPSIFTAAYRGDREESASDQYDTLSYLDYKDANQLLKKGENGARWMAFIVDQDDERPLIMWDKYSGEYFRYSKAAVSSAVGVEAGGAVEKESAVSSN